MISTCDFCQEFSGVSSGRFKKLYRGIASSRLIARSDNFVVLPTLGQLFTGSLLVLPLEHVETCAALSEEAREEMLTLVRNMLLRTKQYGHPIFFEHGATAKSGGGCGIYHAHLHIVPLPLHASVSVLFPEHKIRVPDLNCAWAALHKSDNYLLIGNENETFFNDISDDDQSFQSQFFRRRLVEHFDLCVSWDWRDYNYVEPALIQTLSS